jgi:hypothetical protein
VRRAAAESVFQIVRHRAAIVPGHKRDFNHSGTVSTKTSQEESRLSGAQPASSLKALVGGRTPGLD